MPQNEQQRQKATMKKRSKQKAASKHKFQRQTAVAGLSQDIVRNARSFPILECWINEDWQTGTLGLVQVLVARQQADETICFGFYLVDKFCLGLKNSLAHTGYRLARYQAEAQHMFTHATPVKCPPELAHQMIYGAIEYAAKFGFSPEHGFELTQYILAPRGELEEPYDISYGKDGKPFFVAGPRDNAKEIVKQLERTAGPGNFDYLVMAPPPDLL